MIDWNDAFNTLAYVADPAALAADWAKQAAEARTRLCPREDLKYGPGPRHLYDLCEPGGVSKGLLIIVHGGFWYRFDKSYWTHLAEGAFRRGWTVAMLSYPLAPDARIGQITLDVAGAIDHIARAHTGPVRLVGHSAGGHLVSRMISDESLLAPDIRQRVDHVMSISGVHDLRPLLHTDLNKTLNLTAQEATAESPALATPVTDCAMSFYVGAGERPEFLRQTRFIAEKWTASGAAVSERYFAGHDHFSVLDALTDPSSEMVKTLTDT